MDQQVSSKGGFSIDEDSHNLTYVQLFNFFYFSEIQNVCPAVRDNDG